MSNEIYSKISEKMKQEQFTEEEIRIVGKAKEQLSSYASGGTILGSIAGIALVRARNLKGIPAIAIAGGGFLIGGQMGLLYGAMASIKTIQTIPNFQRVLNIVQEVREESTGQQSTHRVQPPRQDRAPAFPPTGYQKSTQPGRSELITDDIVYQQNQNFEGFKNGDGYHGGNDPNGSLKSDQSSSAWSHVSERAKEIQSHSTNWNQIRSKNLPKSAWDNVRDGKVESKSTSGDSDDESSDKESNGRNINKVVGWDRVRLGDREGSLNGGVGYDGPSDFARTREDLETKPRQTNRYGDAI